MGMTILVLLLVCCIVWLFFVNRRLRASLQKREEVLSEADVSVPVSEVTDEGLVDESALKKGSVKLMAAGVAHDLNNILSGLVSYPELLLMQLPEDSNLIKPIGVIHKSGLRAVAAVSDLLAVTRDIAKNRSRNNINSLILENLQSQDWAQLHVEFPQLKVRTQLVSEPVEVLCSPTHVGKCLLNLIQFCAESLGGCGEVLVGSEICNLGQDDASVNLKAGRYLLVSVADSGAVIAAEDLPHIFEPFYTKKQMGRSGSCISMAVVWNSMLDHEGVVKVESDASGTRFGLYYPMDDEGCQGFSIE
jgi:signal transduction histidine kinase